MNNFKSLAPKPTFKDMHTQYDFLQMHSQWDFLQGHSKTHYPIKARSKEPETKIQIANFDQRRRT